MSMCGCCGKEGPAEWFKTPAGDLCTRCRLAGKRVKVRVPSAEGGMPLVKVVVFSGKVVPLPFYRFVQASAGLAYFVRCDHRGAVGRRHRGEAFGKLDARRKERVKLAIAIRQKLRYCVFWAVAASPFEFYEHFGCSIAALRDRVRRRLPDGVCWEDCGRTWKLSFKRALSSYRLEKPAEFKKAASFRNVVVVLLDKKGTDI